MTPHDLALRFLAKARQDEIVIDKLMDDGEISDEALGFHYQQAVEKLLKAVLAERDVEVPKTHNLIYLMDALGDAGCSVPEALEALAVLNPFAVVLRYDLIGDDPSLRLDRQQMRSLVRELRTWTETKVLSPNETG